jgi:hypothetical protein
VRKPSRMAATILLKEWISWTSKTTKLDILALDKLVSEGSSSIGPEIKKNQLTFRCSYVKGTLTTNTRLIYAYLSSD